MRPAPKWPYEWQVGDFSIHSDFDFRERVDLIDDLQRLRGDLESSLGITIARERIHLILFATSSRYRSYLRKHFPGIPDRRALFIKRRGPGMVFAYDSHEMAVDLRHETTHAMLNASLPYVPLWLDEGLAEYFEVSSADRPGKSPHLKIVRLRALIGQVPDLVALDDLSDLSAMGAGEYRDAWSWVHFLLHESEESRQVLLRFLAELQAQSPPGPLSRRIAAGVPDYQQRYLKHFRAAF